MRYVGAAPAGSDEVATRGYVDAYGSLEAIVPPAGWLVTDKTMMTAAAGLALTSGRGNFHRLYLMPGTYDSLWVTCSTAQGGTTVGQVSLLLGLYPDDGSGTWPDTTNQPIASATISSGSGGPLTSTGMKQATFASPLVITKPTLLWVCSLYLVATAPTTPPVLVAISTNLQNLARPTTLVLNTATRGYFRSGLAALPSTASTPSNVSVSGSADITAVAIRRSA